MLGCKTTKSLTYKQPFLSDIVAVYNPADKLSIFEVPPKLTESTSTTVPLLSAHETVYGAFPPVGETYAVAVLSPKHENAVSEVAHIILYISKFKAPAFSKYELSASS